MSSEIEKKKGNTINIHNKEYKKTNNKSLVSDSSDSYSMANNYLTTSVNSRTGELTMQIHPPKLPGILTMDINLGIHYNQSDAFNIESIMGLPSGWSYNISYIIGNQIHINGTSSYQLDPNMLSGMRYYKLKNLQLKTFSFPNYPVLPYDKKESYSYILKSINGQNQYFDAKGRLIAIDDKYENHILFYYDLPNQDVNNSKLKSIIDSYGQTINLLHSNGAIEIKYPEGGQNTITFSYLSNEANSCLNQFVDPLGGITTIEYHGGVTRTGLISKINYPNQLSKAFAYSTINYLTSEGVTLQKDVIESVTSIFEEDTRVKNYSFLSNGNNYNYLGFPRYKSSPNSDVLLESYNSNYMYSSALDNGVTKTVQHYNHLHLLMYKEVFSIGGDMKKVSQTNYKYVGEGSDNYFPPFDQLPSNYQSQIQVISEFFNNEGQSQLHKTETKFNDYAQITSLKQYESEANGSRFDLISQVNSTYDNNFGILIKKETIDYKPKGVLTQIPTIQQTINTLSVCSKQILIQDIGYLIDVNDTNIFSSQKINTFTYDSQGRVTSKTQSWGKDRKETSGPVTTNYKSTYIYNSIEKRNIVKKQDSLGNITTKEYDACTGFLLEHKNALGASSKYTYDALGRHLSRIDPIGAITKWLYDTTNNKITKTLGNGYKTYTYYNGFGNEIKKSDNLGQGNTERVIQMKCYDSTGRKLWQSGILGNKSKLVFSYDFRGLLASKSDALGNTTTYTYDSVSKTKTSFFNGLKTKVEQYNVYRKIITSENYSSNLNSSSVKHDLYNKQELKVFLQSGEKKEGVHWTTKDRAYGLAKKMTSEISQGWDSVENTETFIRDLFNKIVKNKRLLKETNNPTQEATSSILTHNSVGLLVEEMNPLNQSRNYDYDEVGNLLKQTNFDGSEILMTYYANRKIKSKSYIEKGGTLKSIKYSYDKDTKLIKMISAGEDDNITYTYELDGKIKSITYPDGKILLWYYNHDLNQLDRFVDAGGNVTQYSYDPYGRLNKIESQSLSVVMSYYSKTVDVANSGRLQAITYSNGLELILTYNGYDLLDCIQVKDIQKRNLLKVGYNYDEVSKTISSIVYSSDVLTGQDSNYSSIYSYNALGKLLSETVKDAQSNIIKSLVYNYDVSGNVKSKTVENSTDKIVENYAYDKDNKLLSSKINETVHNLFYDSNGNMLKDGFGNTYTYNVLNQLVNYTNNLGNTTSYSYYPSGLRRSKSVQDSDPIVFYYDNNKTANIVNEIQGSSIASYLTIGGLRYARIVKNTNGRVVNYMIHDKRDVLLIIDEQDNVVTNYNYSPYGNDRKFSGSINKSKYNIDSNPFKYTHEYLDEESNLYYLRARYYYPKLMRFINRDSIQIFNHYNYANGNPVMMTDKSGHQAWWSWLITGIVFLATAIATIASFGAAAPAAAAADAADLGGLAADAGVSAAEASAGAGTAVDETAQGTAIGASDELGVDTSENALDSTGFDPANQTLPRSYTNPNGLDNNCVFCTAGEILGQRAPDVAAALGLPEGTVATNAVPQVFEDLGLSATGQFDINATADPAEAFDFMAQEPAGTRFSFIFRTGVNMYHNIVAESEGLGNAVSLYDAQSGLPLFGDPTPVPDGYGVYYVIRIFDAMQLGD